ncbi:MAG TPA: CBS domain-containing protein [Bacillales bacterium]|nr:CBS domain-containing protein [Bacillales bacterium]
MAQGQSLRELMSQNVVTVTPNQTLEQAASLMSQYNIGSLPVVENGRLCGVITDRDITLRSTAQGKDGNATVSECMSSNNIVSASPDMAPQEAAQLMAERQIRRLPVVDNGQIVGMVALGDLATQNVYASEASHALSSISVPSQPQG